MSEQYTVKSRIGRTVKGKLVPYEDPSARFLAYPPGAKIPMELAKKSGLIKWDGKKNAAPPADPPKADPPEDPPEDGDDDQKAQAAPEDKMQDPPEDKGVHIPPEVTRSGRRRKR